MSSKEPYWIPYRGPVPLRAEPSHRSEMVSQLLWGEPQQIFSEHQGWLQVRGYLDGYIGWVPVGTLMAAWSEGGGWAVVQRRWAPILRRGQPVGWASVGAVVPKVGFWRTAIGDFSVPAGAYRAPTAAQDWRTLLRPFIGAPYLWGGKTPAGIDCSALVQLLYRLRGYLLPRDAYQQAEAALPTSLPKPGDLVFFTSQRSTRISHVGLYLGRGKLLHATPAGAVHMGSLAALFTHTFHSFRTPIAQNFVI